MEISNTKYQKKKTFEMTSFGINHKTRAMLLRKLSVILLIVSWE